MNLQKLNVVLLVVAGALAVPTTVQLLADAESFVDTSRIPLLFDGFTPENVGAVVIGTPKKEQPAPNPQAGNQKPAIQYDQLALQRTDQGWTIAQPYGPPAIDLAGAPVGKDKVENDVFFHLQRIRNDKDALVQRAATPEQLAGFGLDDAHATLVKVTDRGNQVVVAELYVGSEAGAKFTGGEGVRGLFVRKADSNDVVLYEYERPWNLAVQTEPWLDKVLLKLDPTQVTRLSLRNAAIGPKPLVFERKDGKASWTCAEPPPDRGALRQTEVENFLQRLRWIAAQDFRMPLQRAGNLQALGLSPPQIELEIGYQDGEVAKSAKFSVGSKIEEKNEVYLTCSESSFLMTWPAPMATQFETSPAESWFDPAPPKETPKEPAQEAPKEPAKEAPKETQQPGGTTPGGGR
ncbi:MAG: DUF4340 domain-containing protein [Planctomycetes bacterium]|nr:DUF4340 domain-containing protein [Planctomycetota bacterium]